MSVSSRPSDVKIAAVWAVAGAAATALLMPYVLAMLPNVSVAMRHGKLPFPLLVVLQCLQAGVVAFGATWVGLRTGAVAGLGSPLVAAWIGRAPSPPGVRRTLAIAFAAGLVTGVAILALQRATAPLLPAMHVDAPHGLTRWRGFLASFYGGIVEELQFRCFVMGVVVRVLSALRVSAPRARAVAIAVGALAFGGAHLSAASVVWGLTPAVVVVTVGLNALAGVVAGLLYARQGLEHAAAAHFAADLVLHVAAGA